MNASEKIDSSDPIVQWITQCCIYVPNTEILGTVLLKDYNEWLHEFYAKELKSIQQHSCSTSTVFYQRLFPAFEYLSPNGVNKKASYAKSAIKATNIQIARFFQDSSVKAYRFQTASSNHAKALYEGNPWRCDKIAFPCEDGKVVEGPLLDPEINRQTFNQIKTVQNKTCKGIIEKKEPKLPPGKSHLDFINYKGLDTVDNFTEKDFLYPTPVVFQKTLNHITLPQNSTNLLSCEKFATITPLTEAFMGEKKAIFFLGA